MPRPLRKLTIIESDGGWPEELCGLLADSGFSVRSVATIADAEAALHGNQPGVLLARAAAYGVPSELLRLLARLGSVRCVLVGALQLIGNDLGPGITVIPEDEATMPRVFREVVEAQTRSSDEFDRVVVTGAGIAGLRRRLRVLSEVRDLSLHVFSCLDLRRAFELLSEGLRGLLGGRPVALFVYDELNGRLALEAHVSAEKGGLEPLKEVTTFAERAFDASRRRDDPTWMRDGDWAATPILVKGDVQGVMVAAFPQEHELCELYQEAMLTLAQTAGHSLLVCRTHGLVKARADHLTELMELGQAINSITDLQSVMDTVVKSAGRLTGARRCSLMLIDEQTQTLRIGAAIGVASEIVDSVRVPVGEGIAGRVAESGRALLLNDLTTNGELESRNDRSQYDTSAFLAVPLAIRGRIVGVLNLSNKAPEPDFTRADEEVVSLLGSHAAVAIENASLYTNLIELAATDGLTGLYNHQHFFAKLRAALNFARRAGQEVTVLLLDIDHFKNVNDQYGHAQGDRVLRAVAAMIQRTARAEDITARYGGEEFAIICPNTPCMGAVLLGERIRQRVAELTFDHKGEEFGLTISVGVASVGQEVGSRALVDQADRALYRSKREGRDRLSVYDPTIDGE